MRQNLFSVQWYSHEIHKNGLSKLSEKLHEKSLISSFSSSRNSPCVFVFFVFVEQWFDSLILLEVGQLGRIWKLEECRRILNQPLWIDGRDLAHVFLGGLHHLVVDNPLRLSVEQCRGWVNGDHLRVDQSSVSFGWILLGCVPEEPRADGLLNSRWGFSAWNDVQSMPIHDAEQLFPDILSAF